MAQEFQTLPQTCFDKYHIHSCQGNASEDRLEQAVLLSVNKRLSPAKEMLDSDEEFLSGK